MPLPEKMSPNELKLAIEKDPTNEWLKEVLIKKLRLTNTNDYQELKRDYLHYS